MIGLDKIGGRGYPDVAAIGDFYVVRAQGQFGRVGVSACSSAHCSLQL